MGRPAHGDDQPISRGLVRRVSNANLRLPLRRGLAAFHLTLGISAHAAGSLRPDRAEVVVHRDHRWTAGGVDLAITFTGAHFLHASVAACVLNDVYWKAARLGVQLDGVRVCADGGFSESWSSARHTAPTTGSTCQATPRSRRRVPSRGAHSCLHPRRRRHPRHPSMLRVASRSLPARVCWPGRTPGRSVARDSPLDRGNVDLLHREHGGKRALGRAGLV